MKIMPTSVRQRIRSIMFKLPLMITCAEFEEFILSYLDGSMSNRQRRIFEFHLAVCRECRDYLAAYRSAMTVTRDVLDAQTTETLADVPEDLVSAVLAARTPQDRK
ncbi:zf-HC2 domain-containing protein [Anderseniella sp. Alg231-50]|uniref:zf-HC2 domain-containing protein n=1 Tax=Anderseniella sp. Alg231-50 TaxID=1922226 RepID=UPI000D552EE0